jgi:MFS transporter, OFA family, oxalate/formate antiporter
VSNIILFTGVVCYLFSCFGGGYSLIPAITADTFGSVNVSRIYGPMITAGGLAAVVGPPKFAEMKEHAVYLAAVFLAVGFLITLSYKPKRNVAFSSKS